MYTAIGPMPETLSAAVQELLRGQDSAKKLRDLLSPVGSSSLKPLEEEQGGGFSGGLSHTPPATAEDLVRDVLQSFTSTLLFLNSGDSDEVSQVPRPSCCNGVKPEESEESSKISVTRGRRGCYKRRKSSDSRTSLSPNLADDGHQWRKYGQKSILNTNFPRSYFRCTHKIDQGCQATKQVQKVSNDPPLYRTIYHGQHTCQNLLKAPQIILDDSSPSDSSVLLSFKTKKPSDGTAARIGSSNNNPSSCSPVPPSKMKREIREDTILIRMNGSRNQSPSSNYDRFPPCDLTVLDSMIGSDQGEALSSTHSLHGNIDDLVLGEVDFDDMFS